MITSTPFKAVLTEQELDKLVIAYLLLDEISVPIEEIMGLEWTMASNIGKAWAKLDDELANYAQRAGMDVDEYIESIRATFAQKAEEIK